MDKSSASKGVAGYMQSRKGTRPYRAATLLEKDTAMAPSEAWTEKPVEESNAGEDFEKGFAEAAGGEEFDKSAEKKPLRPRVEIYAVTKDGKVLAGEYPDGSVAVPGGGIESGEKVEAAGRREYKEESGIAIKAVKSLPTKPLVKLWTAIDGDSPKMKQRKKEYRGSETHYAIAAAVAGKKGKITDKSPVKAVKPKPIDELISKQEAAVKGAKPGVVGMLRSRLGVLKEIKEMPKVAEFAPGIPKRGKIHTIPRVKSDADNEDWDLSIAKHPAKRRGDHIDVRVVDPKGRAHSWAIPPDVPAPGKSVYAVRQPTHTKDYALQTKPFDIPPGYGETRPGEQVQPISVGKTEVVEAKPDKLRFLRHLGRRTEEFVLRRIGAIASDNKEMWALHNATKNRATVEGKRLPDSKPKYKTTDPEKLDLDNPDTVLSAKIDGAHTITHLHGRDRHARVYSYRTPSSNTKGVIEHTHKLPDFQRINSPDSLNNTVLRTELWFSDKLGKAIPVQKVGGILNAGTLKSRRMQQEQDVKPRLTVIDVVRSGGKNMEGATYADKLRVMEEAVKSVSGLELPPMARSPEEKRRLVAGVKGDLPHTSEGLVEHDLHTKGALFTKAVFRPMHDVFVREVVEEKPGVGGGRNMAAGFQYSFSPDGPIAGKVGTGFDHKTKKDMLNNPEQYVGRVAVVRSMSEKQNRQDPSQIKALRSPSFKHWHVDKTDPELMKEAKGEGYDVRLGRVGSRLSERFRGFDPIQAGEEAVEAVPAYLKKYTKAGKGVASTLQELGLVKGGSKRKSYGPGGKWIHDRAHKIMKGKDGTENKYGDKEGKSIAYAIATQQGHAVKKSPKGFKTPQGVSAAKAKYNEPKLMRKTAEEIERTKIQPPPLPPAILKARIRNAEEANRRASTVQSLLTGAVTPVTGPKPMKKTGMWSEPLTDDAARRIFEAIRGK